MDRIENRSHATVERSKRGACVAIRFKKIGVAPLPPAIAFGKAEGSLKDFDYYTLCNNPISTAVTPLMNYDRWRITITGACQYDRQPLPLSLLAFNGSFSSGEVHRLFQLGQSAALSLLVLFSDGSLCLTSSGLIFNAVPLSWSFELIL
ncbi:hypothetical protein F511_24607 [Dorcoceras hygrometricum]|uniref:Uncharacterized protein n=1 Tax=Dorcoceras hygrometricum TaxID=472368 RepID=A0A2Z7AFG5_9LAMI|nr:hypothetical protein F511_24607 [Dorcoceras hygrometricum]